MSNQRWHRFAPQSREDFTRHYAQQVRRFEQARAARALAPSNEASADEATLAKVDLAAQIVPIGICDPHPVQSANAQRPLAAGTDNPSPGTNAGPQSGAVPAMPEVGSRVRAAKKTPLAHGQPAAAIAVSSHIAQIVGDLSALVLLSQIIYWSRHGAVVIDREGWIHKSAEQWAQETGMTWKVQRRARRILLEQDLIEERLCQMPARLEFRLRLQTLLPKLAELSGLQCPDPDWRWVADRQQSLFGNLLGRSFLFHAALTAHMPVATAMLASRLITATGQRLHASSLQPAAPQWVRLHRADWLREAGLSKYQWQTARRHLRELGLLHERQRNFPRRVDLAIHLQAVRDLVAKPVASVVAPATQPNGTADWAKQVSGIGHRPIQPAVSPNPTHTDRPIQPTLIAQSDFYLLPNIQIQLPLQIGWSSPIWGGWGGRNFNAGRMDAVTVQEDSPGAELIWPDCFEQSDRAVACRHLKGLDADAQQAVLDEIDWQRAAKPVRSPVALLRSLCVKAREGTFIADGAHRIAGVRRKRLERERQELAARAVVRSEQTAIDQELQRAGIAQARAVASGLRANGLR